MGGGDTDTLGGPLITEVPGLGSASLSAGQLADADVTVPRYATPPPGSAPATPATVADASGSPTPTPTPSPTALDASTLEPPSSLDLPAGDPRPRWSPDDEPATKRRNRKLLRIALAAGVAALCLAVILNLRIDPDRHADLVDKVQEVGGTESTDDAELVAAVDALDAERQQANTDLIAERDARAAAEAAATEAAASATALTAERDAAQSAATALSSIFPLSAEALRAADYTAPSLTMTGTPIEGGCTGLLTTPTVDVAGCGVSHVPISKVFALTWDGNWWLRSEGYAAIALALDPATGTLSGTAPITLPWPCYDGTNGQPGIVTVSLTPDAWAPSDVPPTMRAVRFQGTFIEDGAAEGACALSGLTWAATFGA